MQSIAGYLSEIVGAAFVQNGLDFAFGAVRVSDRPDLCQFQCNGAMVAAKKAGKNPREVAQQVLDSLQGHPDIEKLEIAGPGFINIDLKNLFISKFLAENSQNKIDGYEGGTVVLDYGGPNIAKPMHVGHLRSSIIGDALRRMYAAAGYETYGDVHIGDWGLQMGQVLSEMEIRGILDKPVTMEELEKIYPAASGACKEDPARLEMARAVTKALQDGDAKYRKPWRDFIDVSIAGMKTNFERLDVHFDLWEGEASAHDDIAPMVEALKRQNLAKESDGALVVEVAEESDKKEMPPLILYKTDGAVMYGTTDLATIVKRVRDYHPVKIVYATDLRQALHFEQVFRAAKKSGIAKDVELVHAGFGTMNGKDGKPFKSRAGGLFRLEYLIDDAIEKAEARLKEAGLEGNDDIAHKVAIAAIKFADLQNNRVSDYVFDLERMTSFEGKTGPYLLYQAVRIRSLLAKAQDYYKDAELIIGDEDRALALLLCELPDHFTAALEGHVPHVLCEYVYKLAQAFSSFYGACHILSEGDAALRQSRLRLCAMTHERIVYVLGLLGIYVPEKM